MIPQIPNRLPLQPEETKSLLRLRATLDAFGFQTQANVPSYHAKALDALRKALMRHSGERVVTENMLAEAIHVTGKQRPATLGRHGEYLALRSRLLDNRWVCSKERADTCEAIADAVHPIRLVRPYNLVNIFNYLSNPAGTFAAAELIRDYIPLVLHAMRERPINGERMDEDYYVVSAVIFAHAARHNNSTARAMLAYPIPANPIRAFNGSEYTIEPAKNFPVLGDILESHVAALMAGRAVPLKGKILAILKAYAYTI